MIMTTRRSIVSRIPVVLVGLLVTASFLPLSGCSTFSSIKRQTNMVYKGVSGSAGAYRKIMVVLPFENSAPWVTVDLNDAFAEKLQKEIETDGSGVHMLMPDSQDYPPGFSTPPRRAEGELDSTALTDEGRASGVNLTLSVRLVDMQHLTEDRGMLWFAEIAHIARIQMDFTIYHTGTGAKLNDMSFFQDIDISETEGKLIDAHEMPGSLPLEEALAEIAEKIGMTSSNILKRIPWEGYVARVDGDRIVLSAGELCGLEEGSLLKVFKIKQVTVEETGQRFFSPGEEIGTISVSAVYPDRSEAVVKDGGPVATGYMVRAR